MILGDVEETVTFHGGVLGDILVVFFFSTLKINPQKGSAASFLNGVMSIGKYISLMARIQQQKEETTIGTKFVEGERSWHACQDKGNIK